MKQVTDEQYKALRQIEIQYENKEISFREYCEANECIVNKVKLEKRPHEDRALDGMEKSARAINQHWDDMLTGLAEPAAGISY